MTTQPDPFKENKLQQTLLFVYLLPVVGLVPSFWTLTQAKGSSQQKNVSRIGVTLTLGWLLAYGLLTLSSSQASEILSLRLSYLNILLTSGYFLTCFVMMFSLWRGKTPRLWGANKITQVIEPKDPF